ncbi:MAG: outer membrane protein transport protein [Acidobacteriota bacterium]|nr:outer membrane protein transport protein [Acidobacteriota bacterium]
MRTDYRWNTLIAKPFLAVLLLLLFPLGLSATDGHFLHGAGPVNEAMGGADTGICLDATGSIAWNPACTAQFKGRRFEFHGTIFVPWRSLSSTVDANAFGPGMPSATLSGTTVSHTNTSFMPGLAFIYHPDGSRNAYHAAMLAVSGFGVDYDQNTDFSNPILTPQAPNGFGFGKLQSNYALLTMPLGMSRQVSDHLSAGFSLVPAFSMLKVVPAPFATPVTAGSTMAYYLSASNSAWTFGVGAQAGLQYKFNDVWSAGVSYHTPVWFRDFKWQMADLTGAKHNVEFEMDLPQLVSLGVGISPSERTHIGVDARWFDYADTTGFDKSGYNNNGAVVGFGWNSIWAVGGGVEQQVTSSTKVIGGYNYSQNPVPAKFSFFNTPAPAIVQHHVSGGVVQKVGSWDVNVTYYHAFQNSITGPWISGQGPIPGTSVTSKMSENSVTIGLAKSF